MLWSAKRLHGLKIHATDGEIGSVEDCFFDDERWIVRYLVVNTGGWLLGRRVLISPIAIDRIDRPHHCLDVHLTRQQVADSPAMDSDRSISPREEVEYYRYFRWPVYWMGGMAWGAAAFPGLLLPIGPIESEESESSEGTPLVPEHHIRSASEISGYYLQATDGEIGHVEDLLFDDKTWEVSHLVAGTRNWWPGKRVRIPVSWLQHVGWNDARVDVRVTREQIREAPPCPNQACIEDDDAPISEEAATGVG